MCLKIHIYFMYVILTFHNPLIKVYRNMWELRQTVFKKYSLNISAFVGFIGWIHVRRNVWNFVCSYMCDVTCLDVCVCLLTCILWVPSSKYCKVSKWNNLLCPYKWFLPTSCLVVKTLTVSKFGKFLRNGDKFVELDFRLSS